MAREERLGARSLHVEADRLYTYMQSLHEAGFGSGHNLLSTKHPDTTPASPPARGSIILADSNRLWTELAIGAVGTFLRSNGTDPAWATIQAGDLPALDHGALMGLADDDHGAVYPGLVQSETITGLWSFSRSTNPPFAVNAGAAVVTNLDADLLDGNHASAFATAGHNHDHGALTGLADDDHGAIYPGLAQAETITGLWSFSRGANPPFVVNAGATMVANLDADKLDGQHASDFATAGHTHDHGALTGLSDDDHGAVYPGLGQSETITGLWTFSRGASAPFAVASGAAVVTSLDADMLDGQHASDFATAGHNHDHGALTGLGDDDHGAVYPGIAQTETITGAWTFDRAAGEIVKIGNSTGGAGGWASGFSLFKETYSHARFGIYGSGTGASAFQYFYICVDQSEASPWANAEFKLSTSGNLTLAGTYNGVDVANHDARHERAGADEIDGDHLDIDWNPSNYTPATTPSEAASVDDLTAHLYGIDQALAPGSVKQGVISLGQGISGSATYDDVEGDFYFESAVFGTTSATWRITIMSDGGGRTAYAQLYDVTGATSVQELTTTATTWTHLSAAVTLTNGHYYRLRVRISSTGAYGRVLGSWLHFG